MPSQQIAHRLLLKVLVPSSPAVQKWKSEMGQLKRSVLMGKTGKESLPILLNLTVQISVFWAGIKNRRVPGFIQASSPVHAATGGGCFKDLSRVTKVPLFLSAFQSQMVTPYLHILVRHCTDIVQHVGTLGIFDQQAEEKLNHAVTSTYFSVTNYHDSESQIVLRRSRVLKHVLNDM